jgi:hypothetical protein
VVHLVVLKMLPFDNESEFESVVDIPEFTSLEAGYQIDAVTASPVGFNGLA